MLRLGCFKRPRPGLQHRGPCRCAAGSSIECGLPDSVGRAASSTRRPVRTLGATACSSSECRTVRSRRVRAVGRDQPIGHATGDIHGPDNAALRPVDGHRPRTTSPAWPYSATFDQRAAADRHPRGVARQRRDRARPLLQVRVPTAYFATPSTGRDARDHDRDRPHKSSHTAVAVGLQATRPAGVASPSKAPAAWAARSPSSWPPRARTSWTSLPPRPRVHACVRRTACPGCGAEAGSCGRHSSELVIRIFSNHPSIPPTRLTNSLP